MTANSTDTINVPMLIVSISLLLLPMAARMIAASMRIADIVMRAVI